MNFMFQSMQKKASAPAPSSDSSPTMDDIKNNLRCTEDDATDSVLLYATAAKDSEGEIIISSAEQSYDKLSSQGNQPSIVTPEKAERSMSTKSALANVTKLDDISTDESTHIIPPVATDVPPLITEAGVEPIDSTHIPMSTSDLTVPSIVGNSILDEPEQKLLQDLIENSNSQAQDPAAQLPSSCETHDFEAFMNVGNRLMQSEENKELVSGGLDDSPLEEAGISESNDKSKAVENEPVSSEAPARPLAWRILPNMLLGGALFLLIAVLIMKTQETTQPTLAVDNDVTIEHIMVIETGNGGEFEEFAPESAVTGFRLESALTLAGGDGWQNETLEEPQEEKEESFVASAMTGIWRFICVSAVVLSGFIVTPLLSYEEDEAAKKETKVEPRLTTTLVPVKPTAPLSPLQRSNRRRTYQKLPSDIDLSMYENLRVVDLRPLLRSRNQKTSGKKVELIRRLVGAYEQELWDLTVPTLRALLEEKNLDDSGLKPDLVARLVAAGL